jgi:hypothetical protein
MPIPSVFTRVWILGAAGVGFALGSAIVGGVQQFRIRGLERDIVIAEKATTDLRMAVVVAQSNATRAADDARRLAEDEARTKIGVAELAARDATTARGSLRVCKPSASTAASSGDPAGAGAGDARAGANGRQLDPDLVLAMLSEQFAARADRYGALLLACQRLDPALRSAVTELTP